MAQMARTRILPKPGLNPTLKLAEIAKRISHHLDRFESDDLINTRVGRGNQVTKTFYNAGAFDSGRCVRVVYVSYQGSTALSKQDALTYLQWLDAGNVGKHWKALGA